MNTKIKIVIAAIFIVSSSLMNGQEKVAKIVSFDSPETDYSCAFYEDGLIFCTTREKRKFMNKESGIYTDLYFTKIVDGEFEEPESLLGKAGSRLNDGPVAYDKTTEKLFYTSNLSNYSQSSPSTLGVFTINFKNNKWVTKNSFDYNKSDNILAHPAISLDGEIIVFVSNMNGSKGGSVDLYYCMKDGNYWTKPKSLGKDINTRGREQFPVFNPDGKLYFASNGKKESQGLDIYSTEFVDGIWTLPVRLSEPINSSHDDFSYVFSNDLNMSFVSSSRKDGMDQIFQIVDYVPEVNENMVLDYEYLDYIMVMMDIEEETKVNLFGRSFEGEDAKLCQEKSAQMLALATQYLRSKNVDMTRISVKNYGSTKNAKDLDTKGTYLQYEAICEGAARFITVDQLAVSK